MAQRRAHLLVSGWLLLSSSWLGCGPGAIEENDVPGSPTDAVNELPAEDGGVLGSDTPSLRGDAGTTDQSASPASSAKTLHAEGREILDTCGQPFVARGVEQITAKAFSPDGSLSGLASELIKTGSNAVRLLPTEEVTASALDTMLATLAAEKIVVYISPGDRAWFSRPEIKEVLLRHERGLVLDAFQEPDYEDVTRWLRETKAAIAELRAAGYSCPLTVLTVQFGRDLTAALQHGAEVAGSDPLHNTIIGWQAYWGKSGWYQGAHKMSLTQGVERCGTMGFPMQLGIDRYADANDEMDYVAVMAAAQKQGIGWLWWNFWNQWDNMNNNASTDGTVGNLTAAGKAVLHSDPNSIERTAKKACFR